MIRIVTAEKEIKKCQISFQRQLENEFSKKVRCIVGFRGGNLDTVVMYSSRLDLWLISRFVDEDLKYWNGFGIGLPIEHRNNSLTVEINFPNAGLNRRIAGVFAKEDNGKILVLHSGKIGGGKIGIGKSHFIENFRGEFVSAFDGNNEHEFCLVGELGSPHFPDQLENFIYEVHRVKSLLNTESSKVLNSYGNFSYTAESSGQTVTENNEPRTITRTHGIIVSALARQLEARNLRVGNDRNRDLFIYKNGKINTLFEIKTSSSTQNLYSVIGQLLLYSIPMDKNVKLIAVLPTMLNSKVMNRILKLGIDVLYYSWNDNDIVFYNLDQYLL